MTDAHRIRFAKLKLVGLAKTNWQAVQVHLERLNQAPITLWAEMKSKLNQFIKGLHVHINGKLAYSVLNFRFTKDLQVHIKREVSIQCPKLSVHLG